MVYDLITRYEIRTLHALKYAISHRSMFQKLQMRCPVVVDEAGISSPLDGVSQPVIVTLPLSATPPVVEPPLAPVRIFDIATPHA